MPQGQAIKVGDIWTGILSSSSGKSVNYKEVTTWWDGSVMDDSKTDGTLYRKRGSTYLKLVYDSDIDVSWFGAVGDGVTDDTVAIKNALSSIPKGQKLFFPSGTYVISDTLTLDRNISISSSDGVLFFTKQDATLFEAKGTLGDKIAVTQDIAKNGTITVEAISQIFPYDYLLISTDENYFVQANRDYKKGEIVRVLSVDPDTKVITLFGSGTEFAYTLDGNNLSVQKITPIEGVNIKGLSFKGTGETQAGFRLWGASSCTIDSVHVSNFEVGIELHYSFNVKVAMSSFKDIVTNGTGYGVSLASASSNNVIIGNYFDNCRHGVTTAGYAGVCMNNVLSTNIVTNCTNAGLNNHGNSRYMRFTNNMISNCLMGISCYAPHNHIENNSIYRISQSAIYLTEAGAVNLRIHGNSIDRATLSSFSTIQGRTTSTTYEQNDFIEVTNNRITNSGVGGGIIFNEVLCTTVDISHNNIYNIVQDAIKFSKAENISVHNNTINAATSSAYTAIILEGINNYSPSLPYGSNASVYNNHIGRFGRGLNISSFTHVYEKDNIINTLNGYERVYASVGTLHTKYVGESSLTSDGTTAHSSYIDITHGLLNAPTNYTITPMNEASMDVKYSSIDATKIRIYFNSVPVSGAIMKYKWSVEVN